MSALRTRALAAGQRLERRVRSLTEAEQRWLGADLERSRSRGIVGSDDRVDVHWLHRGQQAAAAVGRIDVLGPFDVPLSSGTAFVVAPGVVLTNHHVLPRDAIAARARLLLGYERSVDGQVHPGTPLRLDPDTLFLADPTLDYALVAVDGVCPSPLFISLAPVAADVPLVVVQHPGAAPKQLSLGHSHLASQADGFLHYSADTRRGSSGAPVFDLSWRVVALHREAVPRVDDQGGILARDGQPWTEALGADAMDVIANEGVLMGSVATGLWERKASLSSHTRQQVETLLAGWGQ